MRSPPGFSVRKPGFLRQTQELRYPMRLNHMLLCAAISAPAFPAAAQACNPIEILFGCRQASVVPAAPAHVRRQAHATVRYTIHAKRKPVGNGKSDAAERQTPLPPPDGVAFASIEHFAADPTLRSGDIVVTTRGFLVFHGDERFTALDNKHASLASLEKASRRPAALTWQSSSPLAEWTPTVNANPVRDGAGVRTISFAAYR
jgi:hypothetical protein